MEVPKRAGNVALCVAIYHNRVNPPIYYEAAARFSLEHCMISLSSSMKKPGAKHPMEQRKFELHTEGVVVLRIS